MSSVIRRTALAVVLACAIASADSLSVEVRKPPRPLIYAAEFGAGLGGLALTATLGVGLFYGGVAVSVIGLALASGGFPPGLLLVIPGTLLFTVGSALVLGSPAAGAYCASVVGNRWREGGSLSGAAFCAYVGLVPGVGIGYFGYHLCRDTNAWAAWPFYLAGAVCATAGAVLGYNLGIPDGPAAGSIGWRLQPPGITLTSVEHLDHSVEYGVKVQLAGLRF